MFRYLNIVVCFRLLLVTGITLSLTVSFSQPALAELPNQKQTAPGSPPRKGTVRVATFNVSMNRPKSGQLLRDLVGNTAQIRKVASIIRLQRPDIILLNEFDYDSKQASIKAFTDKYLNADRPDIVGKPIQYPYVFSAAVNTGVDSKMDLNQNGKTGDAADSFGFGTFAGQYGMVVLSKYPIQKSAIRTFQKLRWARMPKAAIPIDPKTQKPWYPNAVWKRLRLSSKSHWDVPVLIDGATLHVLASHPTPPAFDGPEDRNGKRNHDEIRFWADYVTKGKGGWITDDQGVSGGAKLSEPFVIMGDLNADPVDGSSYGKAIHQLLKRPNINAQAAPVSEGAAEASRVQKRVNLKHKGDPATDTADFSDGGVGNLRADYVLPSRNIGVVKSGVFWPIKKDPLSVLLDCSDHHLVWLDIALLVQ